MNQTAEKKAKSMHPLVLITTLVIIAALLTFIVPAGQFERVVDSTSGRTLVVAGSYEFIDHPPVSLGDFLLSFNSGIQSSVSIIAFLMLIGGSFGIVTSTGAINALMAKFIVRFKSEASKNILICGLFLFFFICGGTFGMALEGFVFAPFLIILMINMGYDRILGIALPLVGSSMGYASAYLNPFTLGIAQEIAGLPFTSGVGFRLALMGIFAVTTCWYLLRYAKKVKADPSKSYCLPEDYVVDDIVDPEKVEFTARQKGVLLVFVGSILFLIYGTFRLSFFMAQCATVFLFMGVLAGFVNGMRPSEIGSAFVSGVKDMVLPCLIVGFARAIITVMESAVIMDTIVYYATAPLMNLSPLVTAPAMVIVQAILNFFVSSGAAQAVVTMPLMVPISDLLGVNRQVAVLAYQLGDGLSNMLWITSSVTIVGIGIAKVSYNQWLKFVMKLFFINLVIGMVAITLAQVLNWGPF